jgi:hypothetical protein
MEREGCRTAVGVQANRKGSRTLDRDNADHPTRFPGFARKPRSDEQMGRLHANDEAGFRQDGQIGFPARPEQYCTEQTEADRLLD